MGFSGKQKKYIKKHLKKDSLGKIANYLGVSIKEVENYLQKRWKNKKVKKLLIKKEKTSTSGWQKRVLNFNFKVWFRENKKFLVFLSLFVFAVYINSLDNEFVSDDVAGVLKRTNLGDPAYIFSALPLFTRQLAFFIIFKIFGKVPFFYRSLNVLTHLGVVFGVYFLISFLNNKRTAFLSSLLMAVHPINIEAITWISGGGYSNSSFLLILAFIYFIFSYKARKYYKLMIIFFLLSLATAEKTMVFPLILLVFLLVNKSLKKDWKKLISPFIISGVWVLIYFSRVSTRVAELQTGSIPVQRTMNPLFQIPIAIISYFKLIFWPKDLTLYHSEMKFTSNQYILYLFLLILFIGVIIYSFKRNKQIFFWLLFFIISLLPTLTPFGISWIVAERYVYLGAIGVFVSLGILIERLLKNEKYKTPIYIVFSLIILTLSVRTIRRNIDWKNQDNLWLAASKTSPNSSQNHNNLGDYYGRQGDFEGAVKHFKKAIELRPGYADAYHNLANAYQQMSELDLAIENYQKALEFNPGLWQTHQALGSIYFSQNNTFKAKEHSIKAIEINPQEANLYINLGIIYLQEQDLLNAQKEIQKALSIDPENKRALAVIMEIEKVLNP
ncbi:hypothetical protein COT75_05070 [Candidatus Beckwithbacteria bacterium CG10_big_fil_rev_8_21_14_0_10_34_10]|uniref:Uncharacterized protein n=1 Tax=Candidatus Beckwithbacteria bacterium CG10_big_fil_rev_8_21_14_0_10_34_10 TaxID=1974495 RepID=A0A2H0W826_9BACT|nr:MAG: hypothetical protein COT75_05070 [Candidatus Beckwithbacteria bacterium CG10_big_fil_rev_8_21_14_0_10_34_10]